MYTCTKYRGRASPLSCLRFEMSTLQQTAVIPVLIDNDAACNRDIDHQTIREDHLQES